MNDILTQLAKNPIDLSKKGLLTPKRIEQMKLEALGFILFYGTERVNDEALSALYDFAEQQKVVTKLAEMQSGKVLNKIHGYPSEDRMVLHTAMRDFFDKREVSNEAAKATELAYVELEKLKEFLLKIEGDGYTDLIQVGIGGSDLGPRAIYLALEAFKRADRTVHYLSNVDPDDAAKTLQGLDLSKTLCVVVSKSGTTLETLTNETLVKEAFKKAGLAPEKHFLAVTGKGSPMDNPDKYLESFYIWDYIGGRYSATSMVGMVSLAFALGMEKCLEFLRGASQMDKHALEVDPSKNLPLLSALLGHWNRNCLKLPTVAIIPYSQAMSRFPAHLQQLDMESNGKQIDKEGKHLTCDSGPIIWGEPGTNGQHSFYQLIHQGTTTVPVEFIGFSESQYGEDLDVKGTTSQQKLLSNLIAQSIGLATGNKSDNPNKNFPGNRPNRMLVAKQCDPQTLGAILAYYEHKVAFQGFLWNINSFDQEGVQLGKVLANKILDLIAHKEGAERFPQAECYLSGIVNIT